MSRLILCSASPRRKRILDAFSLPYEQIASNFDESQVPYCDNPIEYVQTLAANKCAALRERFPEATLLGADTAVFLDGHVFNKPEDENDARAMLRTLSGKWHSVFSGVCVTTRSGCWTAFEETKVLLNCLSADHIDRYLRIGAWRDKAGAYAIQGEGGLLVQRIDGCYYNVLGLPVNTLQRLLANSGMDLWHHLRKKVTREP